MLFAAGFGTRMRPLTDDRPKPLVEVAGRPLIDHALGLAAGQTGRVVANLHYRAPQLEVHLAPLGVTTILETPEILDTGGGLRNALPLLGGGPVLTLNTDAIWRGGNPLAALRAAFDPARMDALLMLVRPEDALGHAGRGDFAMDAGGRLTRGPGHIYSGAQMIRTEGLRDIPDRVFSLNRLWDRMIEDGRLFGIVHRGRWCDVGHPESIELAESLLERPDV
nr:nucleotidyltransferase family protein [Anianabacter salinae]